MEKNVGTTDKVIRLIVAIILLAGGISLKGLAGTIAIMLGIVLLFTVVTGFCGLYKIFGITTCKGEKKSPDKK